VASHAGRATDGRYAAGQRSEWPAGNRPGTLDRYVLLLGSLRCRRSFRVGLVSQRAVVLEIFGFPVGSEIKSMNIATQLVSLRTFVWKRTSHELAAVLLAWVCAVQGWACREAGTQFARADTSTGSAVCSMPPGSCECDRTTACDPDCGACDPECGCRYEDAGFSSAPDVGLPEAGGMDVPQLPALELCTQMCGAIYRGCAFRLGGLDFSGCLSACSLGQFRGLEECLVGVRASGGSRCDIRGPCLLSDVNECLRAENSCVDGCERRWRTCVQAQMACVNCGEFGCEGCSDALFECYGRC
jgi:hypothetical protein